MVSASYNVSSLKGKKPLSILVIHLTSFLIFLASCQLHATKLSKVMSRVLKGLDYRAQKEANLVVDKLISTLL